MSVTRKTHEVGRSYLSAWRDPSLPNKKMWYFDLKSQKISSVSCKASFAIRNYLYVPMVGGVRDDSTEKWLSSSEDALARFIKKIGTGDFTKPIKVHDLVKVIFGLISLSYRSGYEIKTLEGRLNNDQTLREQMGVESESEIHRVIVENMVNVISMQVEQYLGGSVGVITNCKSPLIVSDRPGFDMDIRTYPFNVIPLKPDVLVTLERPDIAKPGQIQCVEHDGDNQIIQIANNFTIERARQWIVASSREQLEALRDELTPNKLRERTEKDSIELKPIDEHTRRRLWSL